MLPFEPSGSHAELDAATGDVVGGNNRLGKHGRMPERGGGDEGAEPQRPGSSAQCGDRGPRVEGAKPAVGDTRIVVRAKQGVEALPLGRLGEREPLLPGHALLPLDHQTDSHRASPSFAVRPAFILAETAAGSSSSKRILTSFSPKLDESRRTRRSTS